MASTVNQQAHREKVNVPLCATSHPDNPIPEEPKAIPHLRIPNPEATMSSGSPSSLRSIIGLSEPSSESDSPSTPDTEPFTDVREVLEDLDIQQKPLLL